VINIRMWDHLGNLTPNWYPLYLECRFVYSQRGTEVISRCLLCGSQLCAHKTKTRFY